MRKHYCPPRFHCSGSPTALGLIIPIHDPPTTLILTLTLQEGEDVNYVNLGVPHLVDPH